MWLHEGPPPKKKQKRALTWFNLTSSICRSLIFISVSRTILAKTIRFFLQRRKTCFSNLNEPIVTENTHTHQAETNCNTGIGSLTYQDVIRAAVCHHCSWRYSWKLPNKKHWSSWNTTQRVIQGCPAMSSSLEGWTWKALFGRSEKNMVWSPSSLEEHRGNEDQDYDPANPFDPSTPKPLKRRLKFCLSKHGSSTD